MTRKELAGRAQVSLRTMSRIEAGEDCFVTTLYSIARALDVPIAELLP